MSSASSHEADFYVGLMSGTSLDGVDAALARFGNATAELAATHYLPYPAELKAGLLALHEPKPNELHTAFVHAQALTELYAQSVHALLKNADLSPARIRAVGCHGQTIRHRPEAGYTVQLVNGARLAELTGITGIVDFRSRDIAAGGQGAPLVPAFHAAMLSGKNEHRVIVNIGGISNLTDLSPAGAVTGFDCGPGNLLLDAWCAKHLGKAMDENGMWAASGKVLPDLLARLLAHDFFAAAPPKSAGREQFNLASLQNRLRGDEAAQDVQATLLELTARAIVDAARRYCEGFDALYVCGGGVHNGALMRRLEALAEKPVRSTAALGLDPDWMEALAFAWLAKQCLEGKPGNLPAVTGASGPRILGAIYPV
ncbi:MAG: anhydro-N-acetylmuramic acid kinase [Pseudomonadota bacterium]